MGFYYLKLSPNLNQKIMRILAFIKIFFQKARVKYVVAQITRAYTVYRKENIFSVIFPSDLKKLKNIKSVFS